LIAITNHAAIFNLKSAILLALAGVAVVILLTLPPRSERVPLAAQWADLASRTVAGAYHIHSTRSDGSGDRAAIAAAASRAGLNFVVITDHGDGTRSPDPPAYVDGVLCIDAVEISTDDGHYVALDMARSPYPLGGSAAAVVEDVARLGGFGIAAHPDSPKPALRWTSDTLPVDGIEWLNADSEWRDESRLTLTRAAIGYLVRPAEALARLLDRPATLARWDRWSSSRPVVALAAADAHGGVGRRGEEAGGGAFSRLGIPSYQASFRTFSNRVVLDRPLSGDAAADARSVVDAIRAGRLFTTIDAVASPGLLDFRRDRTAVLARVVAPTGAQLLLLHDGTEVARTAASELRWESGGDRGPYRAEVRLPGAPGEPPVPWLVSNEIFTTLADHKAPLGFEVPWTGAIAAPRPWRVEKESSSSATLETTSRGIALDYRLGTQRAHSPYVAAVTDVHDQPFTAIEAALSAMGPMRLSIQVRAGESGRWGASVYVDSSVRLFRVPLSAMRGMGAASPPPAATSITSVLLVVDLINAVPGSTGRVEIRGLRLEGGG
jgi:hypothetical protein